MLFKSQVYTQASGSIGGITYSHNRGGPYTRSRAIPTNPGSSRQQTVRNLLSQLTSAWQGVLTSAQREAWKVYDANVTLMNPLGDPIHIGGLQHFVRSNIGPLQAGLDRQDDGPTVFNLGTMTEPGITAAADDNQVDVTFENTDEWANEDGSALLVYGSRPLAPTIGYFKGPYRFIGMIEGDAVTPPTSPASINSGHSLAADQLLYAMIRACRADGRLSSPFRGSCVVAAS